MSYIDIVHNLFTN